MFNPFYYLNKSGKGKTSMIHQSVVEVDNKVATIIVFLGLWGEVISEKPPDTIFGCIL